ncbi:uncharacterized protein LOC107689988 [Sinocyclocheilus anshuiensis]|uniref:uncharacterized protein LOC107689988 n=1 Tax=Sinocyclocheilus anshuiensis TaxID=1608454 RepID=UPI0007B9C163|nr:PREDICTED: uncharacterized protein LOC107689988 [Sinocyclocheilus anshuiensis]
MDQILQGLPNVHCYLDDILVTGSDDEQHLKNVDAVLSRLDEFELCGLYKSPEKVRAIMDAPAPKNVTQLRSFLGLLNYYSRFIPNLPSVLTPLNALLCKGKQWLWSQECEVAFDKAKNLLLSQSVLTHYNPQLPIRLACDTSPYGVGAVISHILPDGQEKPIAFASRTLSKAEQSYAQIEREALGIIFGVRKFYQYLYRQKFTLFTDHRPLTTIFSPTKAIPSMAAARLQHWALLLAAYDYDIQYRDGAHHCNADGLSRLPLPTAPQVKLDTVELLEVKQLDALPVLCADVCPFEGHMYLVVVDAHSKWPKVCVMDSTTSAKTIQVLRTLFSRYGLPEVLVSDNGPQFTSEEFQTFLKANGPNVASVVEKAQAKLCRRCQVHAKERTFAVGDKVLVRDYRRGKKWMPVVVSAKTGRVSYTVDVGLSVHWRRHVDQILAHQDDCDNGDEIGPETIEVPEGNLTDLCEHPISGETSRPSLDQIPTGLAQSEDSATRDNEVVLHTPHKEAKRYPERTIKPPVRFSP